MLFMAGLQGLVVSLVFAPLLLEYYVLPNGAAHRGLGVGAQDDADRTDSRGFPPDAPHYNAEEGGFDTVGVKCRPSTMEIVVQADLFGTGAIIDASDLRLGVNPHPEKSCRPTVSGHGEYTIIASLTDCGTMQLVLGESLIYVNLLIYSPSATPEKIIRMTDAAIPVECYYPRSFHISSDALKPAPTDERAHHMEFSLKLMDSDWQSKHASTQYFLGDYINIEAMVQLHKPTALRLFIDNCVASLLPDKTSSPKYYFVENGCLSGLTTKSRSAFLPRVQENKLQLQLESFTFYENTNNVLYITCLLVAVPLVGYRDGNQRACSFISGRWKSADGTDSDCFTCEQSLWLTRSLWSSAPVSNKLEKDAEKSKEISNSGGDLREWRKEATLGPMFVISTREDQMTEVDRTNNHSSPFK